MTNPTNGKTIMDQLKEMLAASKADKVNPHAKEMYETQKAVLEVLKDPARRAICDKIVTEMGLAYNRVVAEYQEGAPDEEKLLNSDALVVAALVSAQAYLSTAAAVVDCGHLSCVHNEAHLMCASMVNVVHASIDASVPHEHLAQHGTPQGGALH
jgi:hypothetical protein